MLKHLISSSHIYALNKLRLLILVSEAPMNKIYITNHVKSDILNICGLSAIRPYNPNGFTSLLTLGISKTDCNLLEGKLRLIAAQYEKEINIAPDTISTDLTINQCIELIISYAK